MTHTIYHLVSHGISTAFIIEGTYAVRHFVTLSFVEDGRLTFSRRFPVRRASFGKIFHNLTRFCLLLQNENMKSSMCSSLSGDEEHEINVESGSDDYEEENEDLDEDMCNTGTDNEADLQVNMISVSSASSSPSSTLPFSISRLLSADKDIGNGHNYENSQRYQNAEATSLYSNPTVFTSKANSSESVIYSASGGVIKVPAHRPNPNSTLNGPTLHQSPALGSPFPWLAMDPTVIMQRNAAAAMLASHVAKERLTGNFPPVIILPYTYLYIVIVTVRLIRPRYFRIYVLTFINVAL